MRLPQEQQRKEEEQQRRRAEEEQRRKQQEREEEEARQRAEEQQRLEVAAELRRQQEEERKAAFNVQHVKVHFGEGEKEEPQVVRRPKSKKGMIEADRQKAEEKLRRRMEREKAKRAAAEREKANEEATNREAMEEQDVDFAAPPPPRQGGKSFGGYDNLFGDIVTVRITKVVKKLGIAIDGGANTKQKAVIIREISVSVH